MENYAIQKEQQLINQSVIILSSTLNKKSSGIFPELYSAFGIKINLIITFKFRTIPNKAFLVY